MQTLVNLFLETGGPGVVLLVLGGNPLSPNFSETAWNIQTPFYRMDTDSLRMVYVNFHKPICPRDFSMTVFFYLFEIKPLKMKMPQSIHFISGGEFNHHFIALKRNREAYLSLKSTISFL